MFTGCGTALVTPFRKDFSLDEEALRRLVRRQIEAGMDFLVPCGTTGENPTLARAEHLRVVEITLEEAGGKVPVVAGAGGYNTADVIELAREVEAVGANGILSVTPYYNKPTQEGLYQHYKAIASAVRLPIIVYSVQGRTGVNVEPATFKRLAEIDNIVGAKEASGNIAQISSIVAQTPERFHVLSGDDVADLDRRQRDSRRDGAPGPPVAGERFRRRSRVTEEVPAAHGSQLRRVEPYPGEGCHGADGIARAGVAIAHGSPQAREPGADPEGARESRPRSS